LSGEKEKPRQVQIVVEKKPILKLKPVEELEEETIDLTREANIRPAD